MNLEKRLHDIKYFIKPCHAEKRAYRMSVFPFSFPFCWGGGAIIAQNITNDNFLYSVLGSAVGLVTPQILEYGLFRIAEAGLLGNRMKRIIKNDKRYYSGKNPD